jgi:hypothetical protein
MVAAIGLFATETSAQVRVVVMDFSGARAAAVRNQAVRGLSDQSEIELVPSSEAGNLSSAADFASAASNLNVRAFLGGRVVRRGRRYQVTVVARDSTGSEIARKQYRGRNANALGGAVRRGVWDDFGSAILGAPEPAGGGGGGGGGGDPVDTGGGGSASSIGPVAVLEFSGPGAGRARSRVVTALEQAGVEVVRGGEDIEDFDDDDDRKAAAQRLEVAALVGGEVDRDGRTYAVVITVFNGSDGEEIDSAELEGRNANALLSTIESSVYDEIAELLAEGEIPEDDDDDDDDDDDEEGWSGPDGPLPSPLMLIAEFAGFGREFSYTDDLFGALRAYSLGFAPMLGGKLYYFPAAHFTNSFAAHIGLDARIETAFGIKSQDSAMQEFPTTMWGFGIHARVRIPIETHSISAVFGYGMQSFRIEAISPTIPAPDVPDVDYGFLRIGAEMRLVFGVVVSELKLSFLPLLGSGQLGSEEWFPRNSGGGLEAGLVLGFLVTDWLEARAGFEYRRFWFSMNPEPGDPNIAGGALDHYFVGNIGLALHWPASD